MKTNFKITGKLLLVLVTITVYLSSCENENYNTHYTINKNIVAENNLWEVISTNPNLTTFAAVLKKTGYDKILAVSQMFTVFAPDNNALAQLDTVNTRLVTEFVENHVARYSYTASGVIDEKITLLNKKTTVFKSQGQDYYFGEILINQKNIVAANGILHIIGTRLPFFSNIWEYLAKDARLDSVKNYLYSYNKIIFDEEKSIPGDVNELGQTVYLDSVLINANKMFKRLGQLNVEDSSYTAILPTNEAWINAYNKIKPYYRYYFTTATKITADTLQRNNTTFAVVRDLVFSNTRQLSPQDSLTSTGRKVFKQPQYLFEGAQKVPASNGSVYITNNLKYRHWESWNEEIRVEAERTTGRVNTWSNLYDRNYAGNFSFDVSNRRYIEVTPTTASVNPQVTFDIPNTLSGKLNADSTIAYGAAYNIYCVMLPNSMKTSSPKPNKLTFTLFYFSEAGRVVNVTFDNKKAGFVTLKNDKTKVLVAQKVTFPYCEKDLNPVNVKIRVNSNVLTTETVNYTRDMFIDCIILEPVQ